MRPDRRARFGWVSLALWLTLFGLLGSLVATEAAPKNRKQRIQQLRQRLKSLTAKKEQKEEELRETKRTQRRIVDELNDTYERLEVANDAMQASQERLDQARTMVRAATARLAAARERLRLAQERVGRRIAVNYREGPVTYADVILGARNLGEFLDRQYIVSRVMSEDADLLRELRDAQREVEAERQRLVARQNALAAAHAENERRVAEAAERAAEREQLLAQIQQERALQEQQLSELEEDSAEIQSSLENELARRSANPRAYRALPSWSGGFGMPAAGPITSGFGYRFHPVLKYRRLHSGIDIGAPTGTPVYAAAPGEVFHASWRGGYGRCIIVLHAGGVSTLYGHLSRINVSPGDQVQKGQLIGAVGNTGMSTGPHLHFEVRRNGVPVNPL